MRTSYHKHAFMLCLNKIFLLKMDGAGWGMKVWYKQAGGYFLTSSVKYIVYRGTHGIGRVILVAITGTIILAPSHLCPVTSTHLKIKNLCSSFTGAHSSNESQWFDLKIGHQDSSPSNGHQGDISYWDACMWENACVWIQRVLVLPLVLQLVNRFVLLLCLLLWCIQRNDVLAPNKMCYG